MDFAIGANGSPVSPVEPSRSTLHEAGEEIGFDACSINLQLVQ